MKVLKKRQRLGMNLVERRVLIEAYLKRLEMARSWMMGHWAKPQACLQLQEA